MPICPVTSQSDGLCASAMQDLLAALRIRTACCLQVSGKVPPAAAQSAAKRLSNNKALLALELVGYDSSLQTAMQYVFGGSFVCQVRAYVPFMLHFGYPRTKPLALKQQLVVSHTS